MNNQSFWELSSLVIAFVCYLVPQGVTLSEGTSCYVRPESDGVLLGNEFLEREVRHASARLTTRFVNKLSGKTLEVRSEGFRLQLGDKRWFTARDFRPMKHRVQSQSPVHVVRILKLADPELEVEVHFSLRGGEHFTRKWLVFHNIGNVVIRLDTVSVESFKLSREKPIHSVPERTCALRSLGQAVFSETCFFGLEYPAGYNVASGGGITLTQYPGATLSPGATWKSRCAVFGVAEPQGVEARFEDYIAAIRSRAKLAPIRRFRDGEWLSPWWQMDLDGAERESDYSRGSAASSLHDAFTTARDGQTYGLWREYARRADGLEVGGGGADADYLAPGRLGHRAWRKVCRRLTEIVEEEQARRRFESRFNDAERYDASLASALLMAAVGRGPLLEYLCGPEMFRRKSATGSEFLSGVLAWLHSNKQASGESRMVLGDPRRGEPYGYAHRWNNRIFLVLRNPTIEARVVSLQLGHSLGLLEEGQRYVCRLIWPCREYVIADCSTAGTLKAGLSDFEVKVFELIPYKLLRHPVIFGAPARLHSRDRIKLSSQRKYDVWGEPGTRKTISIIGSGIESIQPTGVRVSDKELRLEIQFPGQTRGDLSTSPGRLDSKGGRIKLATTVSVPRGYENVNLKVYHRLNKRLTSQPCKVCINGKPKPAQESDAVSDAARWYSMPLPPGENACVIDLPAGRSNEVGAWVVGDSLLESVQITARAAQAFTEAPQLPTLRYGRRRVAATILSRQEVDCTIDYHPAAAVKFDGKGACVRCGAGADRSDNFTVEAWVLFERRPGPGTPHQPIAARWDPKTRSGWLFYCRSCGGDAGMGFYTTGGAEAYHRTWKAEAGRWYHVAATVENSYCRVFIDGELVAQAGVNVPSLPTTNITVGWFQKSLKERPLALCGMVSELRISRSARYSDEFIPPVRFTADKDTLALWRFGTPGAVGVANAVKDGDKAAIENGAKVVRVSRD